MGTSKCFRFFLFSLLCANLYHFSLAKFRKLTILNCIPTSVVSLRDRWNLEFLSSEEANASLWQSGGIEQGYNSILCEIRFGEPLPSYFHIVWKTLILTLNMPRLAPPGNRQPRDMPCPLPMGLLQLYISDISILVMCAFQVLRLATTRSEGYANENSIT